MVHLPSGFKQIPQLPVPAISKFAQPLSLIHQREDRRSKKNLIPQPPERKSQSWKVTKMKRHRILSQMKGQDKSPVKQLNEVEIGNLPEREFRIIW